MSQSPFSQLVKWSVIKTGKDATEGSGNLCSRCGGISFIHPAYVKFGISGCCGNGGCNSIMTVAVQMVTVRGWRYKAMTQNFKSKTKGLIHFKKDHVNDHECTITYDSLRRGSDCKTCRQKLKAAKQVDVKPIIIYHPSLVGVITDTMFTFLTDQHANINYNNLMINIDLKWGEGTNRPHRVRGAMHMVPLQTYDLLVFSLLKGMFGMDYPNVMVADYRRNFVGDNTADVVGKPYVTPVALVKKMDDRQLVEADYSPATDKNSLFRYRLGILVMFCRLVGVLFSYEMVRVQFGIPYLWRVNSIGNKKAATINRQQFKELFGFKSDVDLAGYYNVDQPEYTNYNGKYVTDSAKMEVALRLPGVNEGPKRIKVPVFDLVLEHMKSMDFDLDGLREIIYLREGLVRGKISGQGRLRLNYPASQVIQVIEENYSMLTGPNPIGMFGLA